MPRVSKTYPYLIALGVMLTLAYLGYTASTCSDITDTKKVQANHGYRIWSGQDLKSFEHSGKTCVPEGWVAIGATKTGDGWARFPDGKTGIIIREDMFTGETLTFENGSPRVSLLYSVSASSAEIEEYTKVTRNAFEKIGALYDAGRDTETHTVIVTAHLRNMFGIPEQVYPDPTEYVTILAYPAGHSRSEELLTHAVMHLFNRHYSDLTEYQEQQTPVPPEDFSELEATWTETAFRTSHEGRMERLRYLYNVHTAVQTKNFSLITVEPFNDQNAFEKIRPIVVASEDSSYVDVQYGHYILAPLAMVATEGLLKERGASTDIETILKKLHTGEVQNFFVELERVIPDDAVRVKKWMLEGDTIPWSLIVLGAQHYE